MKKMQTAVLALTAATGMALMGASSAQAAEKPAQVTPAKQKAPVPLKHRTAKMVVDPADVTVDEHGNVMIKDPDLAKAVLKLQGVKGANMDGLCCGGCGCSGKLAGSNVE
ncbi:MAG: hypothetical protein ABR906_03850 [Terracidiphilus sp.]